MNITNYLHIPAEPGRGVPSRRLGSRLNNPSALIGVIYK